MSSRNSVLAHQAADSGVQVAGISRTEQRAAILTRLSHDLRAPLNAIISFSQILTDGLSGTLNEDQLLQVDIIRKSGNNLLHVIDNVTMLARTDLRNYGATPAAAGVGGLLEKLRCDLDDCGQGEETKLEIKLAEGTPSTFTTDERKLRLALANMIRYGFLAGGTSPVILEVSSLAPEALPVFLGDFGGLDVGDEGYLKLQLRHRCSDTERVQVTDLYCELDELDIGSSEIFHGVHLGLSLARRCIEIIGGRIWFEKTTDGDLLTGAVVPSMVESLLVDPVGSAGPTGIAGQTASDGLNAEESRTILVVEDNPFNRNFIRLIVDNMGYGMIEAENGEIGLSKALERQPDLILMDMMMPVMDGFQATRLLKSDSRTAGIPVLAMTALSLEKDKRKASDAGCDDFLLMPSTREELEAKFRYWAEKSSGGPDSPEEIER
jgi:CheY-like chemotaxis protein